MPDIGGKLVAWTGFVFGSLVSVAGNVVASRIPPPNTAYDWQPSLVAQAGAAVWPITLLLAVEALSRVRWPTGVLWKLARYGGVLGVALGSATISYGTPSSPPGNTTHSPPPSAPSSSTAS